jgi:hypothetical protein
VNRDDEYDKSGDEILTADEILTGEPDNGPNRLWQLRAIAKEIYDEPGEWEREIERERELFADIQDERGR